MMRQILYAFTAAILLSQAMFGQTAQITGRVVDTTEAIVIGTNISVINPQTGLKWQASTNESGYYAVPLLPPGQYDILAQKTGFRPLTRTGIMLEVGQVARVDFKLEVGVSQRP